MKKERFDKLVKSIAANPLWYSTYKITHKDGFEVHTFGEKRNKSLDEAKALFKEKGYKGEEVYDIANKLNNQDKLCNGYYTFLYNSEKDKISIGTFMVGYAYASRKNRFYPLVRKEPILAWTKHIYAFKRTLKNTRSPRIQLGRLFLTFIPEADDLIIKTLYNIDYVPEARISYRYHLNTKDEYEALDSYVGSKIPEVLKHYKPDTFLTLYKSLKNYTILESTSNSLFMNHKILNTLSIDPFASNNFYTENLSKLKDIHYDLFVLALSNKITDEEYKSILTISESNDIEDINMAREIINFKLENGSN